MQKIRYRVGDRVRFKLGVRWVEGIIKEDRGPLGVNGRRLWGVEFHAEPLAPSRIELPEVEMEPVPSVPPAAHAGK